MIRLHDSSAERLIGIVPLTNSNENGNSQCLLRIYCVAGFVLRAALAVSH